MRVSKAQMAKNRSRLLAAAGRAMRKRGIDGIGIDALASAAGMTHGAIYSQFAGKDALAAAAIAQSLAENTAAWYVAAGKAGPRGSPEYFNELVRHYVSRAHRDNPQSGCAMAALATDARRHGHQVRRAFSDHVIRLVDELSAALAESYAGDEARRDAAMVSMATMVGAIILARAVEDPALSDRILLTVRRRTTQPLRTRAI